MINRLIIAFFTFAIVSSAYAQKQLNAYKYVIVPKKFDFLKSENQYRLNELVEFLFKKHNFNAFMEGSDYPKDLKLDRCLALRTGVLKEKGVFVTKLKLVLKDCDDKIVYTSKLGESREKEYKTSYNLAIRDVFNKSFARSTYKYDPALRVNALANRTAAVQDVKEDAQEIKKLRAEIAVLKTQKQEPTAPSVQSLSEQKAVTDVLYAQAKGNGFQLVDSSPKVIFKIKNTGLNKVFLVEGKNAIIYEKENNWFLEYYENETLKRKPLNLKF